MLQPSTIEDLREAILNRPRLIPIAGSSKPGLTPVDDLETLSMLSFTGVLEYEPSEYTFTARAGTRVSEVEALLSENGQYLPFDPPFIDKGATLGGVLASGLSGSGRYRYGGVRDFILGVVFMDGRGRVIKSGGKVVKNAAGFDLPKLMTGSLGAFGAILELTFKVFPKPAAYRTMVTKLDDINQVREILARLSLSPVELHCLDIETTEEAYSISVRIGGPPEPMEGRIARLRRFINLDSEVLSGTSEELYWRKVSNFDWVPQGFYLVKVPLTPGRLLEFESTFRGTGALRRYTTGANLAWIAWTGDLQGLDERLCQLNLSGLRIIGRQGPIKLGAQSALTFYRRVKSALDPDHRWAEVN